jgi:hypothetical protein
MKLLAIILNKDLLYVKYKTRHVQLLFTNILSSNYLQGN